jgi:GGDEF domain-containing protein
LFPLFIGKRTEGALVVVASECDVFDEAEVRLLSELASNLSLALERGQQQQRIDYLAYYDILTGLPNRRLFYERLDQALAVRDAARVALVTFDVERFKTINETFSLAAGDRVLQHFAQRLTSFARDRFVLRAGANEFTMLMPRVAVRARSRPAAEPGSGFAARIGHRFRGSQASSPCAPGSRCLPRMAPTRVAVAQCGRRCARRRRTRALCFSAPSLNARVAERLGRSSCATRSERFEFALHCQPKVRLTDRRVTGFGVAALARAAPEMASPASFVPCSRKPD